jgi:hypothetical protein
VGGIRKGSEKGRGPLCNKEADITYTYLIKTFRNEEAEGAVLAENGLLLMNR